MAKIGYVMNYAGYGADTDKEWMKRLMSANPLMQSER